MRLKSYIAVGQFIPGQIPWNWSSPEGWVESGRVGSLPRVCAVVEEIREGNCVEEGESGFYEDEESGLSEWSQVERSLSLQSTDVEET
jgi:hypothetical protein